MKAVTMTAATPVPLSDYQSELVRTHVGLAQSIAMSFWKRAASEVDRDEIVAIAYQGLITAAQRYEPNIVPENDPDVALPPVALTFGQYAKRRIGGAIQDWMRQLDHVPRRQRTIYKDMQELAPGRSPEETAEILGIDVNRVRAITHAVECPPVSLDDMAGDSDRGNMAPPAEGGTEGSVAAHMLQEAMVEVMEGMPSFEKSVIVLRYYMGMSFPQIAAELGSSVSTVKVTHQQQILLIHAAMVQTARS